MCPRMKYRNGINENIAIPPPLLPPWKINTRCFVPRVPWTLYNHKISDRYFYERIPHGGSANSNIGEEWTPEKNIQPLSVESYTRSPINTGYKRDEPCALDSSRIVRYKTKSPSKTCDKITQKRTFGDATISPHSPPLRNRDEFCRKLVYRVRRWRDRMETKCLMLFDGKADGSSSSVPIVQSINHSMTNQTIENFLFPPPEIRSSLVCTFQYIVKKRT